MTVKELIEELSKLPPNALVICQSDSEGTGHSPLRELAEGFYGTDNARGCQFWYTPEISLRGVPAVALVPMN